MDRSRCLSLHSPSCPLARQMAGVLAQALTFPTHGPPRDFADCPSCEDATLDSGFRCVAGVAVPSPLCRRRPVRRCPAMPFHGRWPRTPRFPGGDTPEPSCTGPCLQTCETHAPCAPEACGYLRSSALVLVGTVTGASSPGRLRSHSSRDPTTFLSQGRVLSLLLRQCL